MGTLIILLYLIAGPLFVVSFAGHVYVKIRLRPKEDSGLDEIYHEFESSHEGLCRYEKWSRITFLGVVVSMLLVFIAAAL